MHKGLRFTKLPILKKHKSGLTAAPVEIEKAGVGVPMPGSEFQAMLAEYIERHPNYRDQQPQKYFETFRSEISPDRMGFNPLGNSLLNITPTKPSAALQRKNSTNKFVTDEIELVSNIMKKANAEIPLSRSRLRAPKTLRPSGESVNIHVNLSPQRTNELSNPNPAPNSRIPRFNTTSATNFKTFSNQPETSYYRGLHSSLYNKIRGRDVTIAPPRKSSPKRDSFRPSAKARHGMTLNPFERLRVQKEFMARKIEELEDSMVDTTDTTKAWILENARDKRIDASKVLGHIIPSQKALPSKANSAQGQSQRHSHVQNQAEHHRDDTTKKAAEEVVKPLMSSNPVAEFPTKTMKEVNSRASILTETENKIPNVVGPNPRLPTVEEELRAENQSEEDEPGHSEGPAPDTGVSVIVNSVMKPTSPLGKLIDLDIYQKKVDMDTNKFARSSTGKPKHTTPVFLITKQGTLVRGAPLSAPKKATKKPLNPIPLRKWTEIPSGKQIPGKTARLRNNQSSAQSNPKQLNNWDGQQIEIEQGDRFAAEGKAQLKTPPIRTHLVESEDAQPERSISIDPPISEKFHEVLRRIRTLEGRFDDMHVEMSALQKEKKIFESYLSKIEKVEHPKNKVPSTPSYGNPTHDSPSESAIGTPESTPSIGDMSVSSTGDEAMTLEFLQKYDSVISIGNDDDHDPTLWSESENEISTNRNIGTYIEEVYERTKTSMTREARKIQQQELLVEEIFHEEESQETDDQEEDEDAEESQILDSTFIPNTASSTDPYEEEDEEEQFTSGSAESDTHDPNFSSQSTGNEDETNSEDNGTPLTPVQAGIQIDNSERFHSWKPEFELDSDFEDRSEDYQGESEGSSEVTVIQQVAPFVERIYENREFDYLYENQAPNPGNVTQTQNQLERKVSQNELGDSLQLTLVNSQAFPFTNLERSVLGHLDELPESPETSATNAFLTPCFTFNCKESVSQLSVVSLPANLPLHLHTESLQIQNPNI